MKYQILLLFALLCYLSAGMSTQMDVQYEDEVALLTPIQFSIWKHRYPYLFVLFNFPTEDDAQTTAEFTLAAKKLQTQYPGIRFARIDGANHTSLAQQINITETNNIGMFLKAARNPIFYTQSRDSKTFASYALNYVKNQVKGVVDVESAREIIANNEDAVFFLGSENSGKFHEFLGALSSYNTMFAYNLTFYQCDEESVREEFGISHNKEAIVIFRGYNEEKTIFGEETMNTENIIKFINIYRYPTVMMYDKKARNRIQAAQEDGIVFFKSNDTAGDEALKAFERVASQRRGQMVFMVIPAGDKEHLWNYALAIFQITEEDFPKVGIIQATGKMNKFLFDGEMTEENLESFIVNYENENLIPFTRSQKIPTEDYDQDNMRVVVGRTFEKIVSDEDNDVLIVFYSVECPYSKAFFSVYQIFADKLRNVKGLVVAKINSDENEILGLDGQGVPAVRFYPKGRKENPKKLGAPSVEQMIKALRKYATADMYEELYEIELNRQEKKLLKEKEREARVQKKLERAERKKQKEMNYDF